MYIYIYNNIHCWQIQEIFMFLEAIAKDVNKLQAGIADSRRRSPTVADDRRLSPRADDIAMPMYRLQISFYMYLSIIQGVTK